MVMNYSCRWNFMLDQPMDPLTDEEALKQYKELGTITFCQRNAKGKTALVCEISPKIDPVKVWFFDELVRVTNCYVFSRYDEKLFLGQTATYSYKGNQRVSVSDADKVMIYYFKPDSDVVTMLENIEGAASKVKSERHGVDVSGNWEKIPEFGQWESLIRFER